MVTENSLIQNLPLVFIDTETTGFYPERGDRVIEIGILKVLNGQIIEEYSTLVDPEKPITSETTSITGIKPEDLIGVPKFKEVKDKVYSILNNSIFVAHNVDFDYKFMEYEFLKHDLVLSSPKLDTIKIVKKLYPDLFNYKLDTIIQMLNIKVENRHRALDDTKALWELYKLLNKIFGKVKLEELKANLIESAKTKKVADISSNQMQLF